MKEKQLLCYSRAYKMATEAIMRLNKAICDYQTWKRSKQGKAYPINRK